MFDSRPVCFYAALCINTACHLLVLCVRPESLQFESYSFQPHPLRSWEETELPGSCAAWCLRAAARPSASAGRVQGMDSIPVDIFLSTCVCAHPGWEYASASDWGFLPCRCNPSLAVTLWSTWSSSPFLLSCLATLAASYTKPSWERACDILLLEWPAQGISCRLIVHPSAVNLL